MSSRDILTNIILVVNNTVFEIYNCILESCERVVKRSHSHAQKVEVHM